MAVYIGFKEKAIEFAKQAVTEDEANNYEKALQLYLASLEYFKTYLKYEKNEKCREAVMAKVSWGGRVPSWRSCRATRGCWTYFHARLMRSFKSS